MDEAAAGTVEAGTTGVEAGKVEAGTTGVEAGAGAGAGVAAFSAAAA